MSEKPYDGTVAMLYGEIEDGDFLAAEDYLPTLPNTVSSARILFLQSKKDLLLNWLTLAVLSYLGVSKPMILRYFILLKAISPIRLSNF